MKKKGGDESLLSFDFSNYMNGGTIYRDRLDMERSDNIEIKSSVQHIIFEMPIRHSSKG